VAKRKESPLLPGMEPRFAGCPAISLVAIPTDLAGSRGADCHI
jgi:hypothetical protein